MWDVDSGAIVTINGCGFVELNSKVFEEIMQPLSSTYKSSESSILCFRIGSEDGSLLFGFPRYERFA